MTRLLLARTASAVPMGAQRYERELISRAAGALGGDWRAFEYVVRSMRSTLPGDGRMPLSWLSGASSGLRKTAGRLLYPVHDVGHRLSLALPPSARCDVVTVHDFVAWRFPDEVPPLPCAAQELRQAKAVITVSEFSADEAERVLGVARPHVIPNGVDGRYFDATPLSTAALSVLGVESPFILCVGGATLRKNLSSLAAAWRLVLQTRPEHTLVLAGPTDRRRTHLFADLPGTVLVGRLPDSMMPSLVAGAACLVVPSTYEGFGLPVLEGMASSVPVVASRGSALTEVVADGGLLVEGDARGLAEGILHAISGAADVIETVRRGRKRAREYTWERCAEAHARVWQSVA